MPSIGAKLLRTRWFVRAPIWVFRARLGFLFGGRLMMLEHVGRKSGQVRYVVLETVDRPDAETVVIASGFGATSQWYRNLLAEPRCRVSVGWRYRQAAMARILDIEETAAVLAGYQVRHPKAYQELGGIIEETTGQGIDTVPMVELSMRG
ncbi:nitroreductase family deazaflavin-dependent oxidoreductase [Nocardia cyriacigeorgica]|uniref:Nitroreductase family deazaflavin-dependent oxidoreductase n=1 Tax=Nocardia cyriacigeorgica TaxID=135487 RepID=A0A6P1D5Y4_9NOCA|nr:nitroreductase family deazaflavin-dependent oxidoreductase [Nocardia cyriacigeorgica]NEW45857.1 nitroreductase family deazaflavin-dependent oxidoreductase [Nocardia cyriacigeorgica]NEW56769.1 nitroreductase family deazaflavin-dependent oxidoreductase [Nocardia cyriacigeorgica]